MQSTLYKQGQGYWTRLMTALGGGVLIFAGAHWVYQQLAVMASSYNIENIVIYQGLFMVLVIGLFGWFLYRWVGVKPRTVDFLIATEGEMKKVNWPTKREVYGATRVVIFVVILFMLVLLAADFVFAWFFERIGVLQT